MVMPAMLVTMSPGFTALPLGMFSQAGTTPTRLTGSLSRATASKVPTSRLLAQPTVGTMHNEVRVRLLSDPLERDPPAALLPFADGGRRIELDLASPARRKRWAAAFDGPLQAALSQLSARGIRADVLSSEAAP